MRNAEFRNAFGVTFLMGWVWSGTLSKKRPEGTHQFRIPHSPFCIFPLLLCIFISLPAFQAAAANQLQNHPSPYLAMHGQDPVDWHDWGPDILELTRKQNKLLFISSGYFSCHWCHVMQRESYQNPAVAEILNRHFIAVKLDRELHPALDAYLIDFVERTRGAAGWPLNVFLTPQGHPLLGFTYEPRDSFKQLLERLTRAWEQQPDRLRAMASAAARRLSADQALQRLPLAQDPQPLVAAFKQRIQSVIDDLQGGFGNQARFPMAPHLMTLLELLERSPDPEIEVFLRLTLDRMAGQGMRDILGGGFFRYTVDPDWQVPHFEKMLYNQALQTRLFLRAAKVLEWPAYRQVARDTLDFSLRQMAGADGGFISSISAVDDQGREGYGYLWTREQLQAGLSEQERQVVGWVWGMQGTPNNPDGYLPVWQMGPQDAAAELEMSSAEVREILGRVQGKLLLARGVRGHPQDGKLLASWNGLMLSALAAGVEAFGETYLPAGKALSRLLMQDFISDGRLLRSRQGERVMGQAALEDYVFVAEGLADWSRVSGDKAALQTAGDLIAQAWGSFFANGWRAAPEALLPGMPNEAALADSPLPSASAQLIRLSLRLGVGEQKQLLEALEYAHPLVSKAPFSYPGSLLAILAFSDSASASRAPGKD